MLRSYIVRRVNLYDSYVTYFSRFFNLAEHGIIPGMQLSQSFSSQKYRSRCSLISASAGVYGFRYIDYSSLYTMRTCKGVITTVWTRWL